MEFVLPQGIFGWNIIGSICRHPVSREGHISAVFIWGVWVCWESLAVGHSLYLWLCCRQQQGTIVYICDCVADDSSGPLFISVTVLQTTAADRCLNLWLYCRRQQRTMVYKTTAADCSLYLWLCCRRHQLTMWNGATDVAEEGTFVWQDGTPVDWTNWDPGMCIWERDYWCLCCCSSSEHVPPRLRKGQIRRRLLGSEKHNVSVLK